jgi:hypothetical protein
MNENKADEETTAESLSGTEAQLVYFPSVHQSSANTHHLEELQETPIPFPVEMISGQHLHSSHRPASMQ